MLGRLRNGGKLRVQRCVCKFFVNFDNGNNNWRALSFVGIDLILASVFICFFIFGGYSLLLNYQGLFDLIKVIKVAGLMRGFSRNGRIAQISLAYTLMFGQVDWGFTFNVPFTVINLFFRTVVRLKMSERFFAGRFFGLFWLFLNQLFLESQDLMFEFLDFFFVVSDFIEAFSLHFVDDNVCIIEILLAFGISYGKILLNCFHLLDEFLLVVQSFLRYFVLLFFSF
jgi:hypothetical protein